MRTWVVGDIHGCCGLLRELLSKIEPLLRRAPGADADRIVFLGDYIDRGPDSRGVVETLVALRREYGDSIVFLKGNHEQWFLEAYDDPRSWSWLTGMGGLATVESYSRGAAAALEEAMRARAASLRLPREERPELPYGHFFDSVPGSHMRLLTRDLRLWYEDENVTCAHAWLNPEVPPEEQTEDALLWTDPGPLADGWRGPRTLAVGHKPTYLFDAESAGRPILREHVVFVDTGALETGSLAAVRFPDRLVVRAGRPV